MNPSQAIVLAVTAANIALMLLFPPMDSIALGRGGAQTLDAFYFVFDRHYNKTISSNLLLIELYWVLANAAIGWLLLRRHDPAKAETGAGISRRTGVIIFLALNLALVWLFPPFENYASTSRLAGTHFDSFYFIFGDKWQRRFYVPLLYMEVLWVLVNSAVLWLLFRDPPPSAGDGAET